MKKFIIDTSAFLRDPNIITNLGQGDVVIPAIIIDELSNASEKSSSYGANARKIGNDLFELRSRVESQIGGLKIIIDKRAPNYTLLPDGFDKRTHDNIILAVAKEISLENLNDQIELISGDKWFIVKAQNVLDMSTRYIGDENHSKKKKQKFNNRPTGKVR